MTRSFKIHSSDYEGDMEGDLMDSSTPFTLAIHYTPPIVHCPKCKTRVESQPIYGEPGECPKCGNIYWWDMQDEKPYVYPIWEEE